MIQRIIKLRLTSAQERKCETWLFQCVGLYNWAIRKIEHAVSDGQYLSYFDLTNELARHSKKCGIPSRIIQGTLKRARESWDRFFKGTSKRPQLKSARNRLSGIDITQEVRLVGNRVFIPGLGRVRYHKDDIPAGKIKACRLLRKASGWHLAVCIDAEPNAIPRTANGIVGIDPGFSSLLTLSNGTKIDHPRELEASAQSLARAQRGGSKQRAARIHERIANQRRDRNHKMSRKLVSENSLIAFSADSHKTIAKLFGKSVASSSHAQLRCMLAYKSRLGGTRYVEVPSRNSTRACSACGSLSGPSGFAGLKVRDWVCADCGTAHDRDCNAAMNTLILGARSALGTEIASKEQCARIGGGT